MDTPLLLAEEAAQDKLPVSGGVFFVRQTHLGFCPSEVTLQLRPKEMVLLNEDVTVTSYRYSNLVMWTQTNSSVTILFQNNLKRMVLVARGRRNAKKIVLMLHSITTKLEHTLRQKLQLWGLTSSDLHSPLDSFDAEINSTQDMFESQDFDAQALETYKLFIVEQTHLPQHPKIVMFRIGKEGISLLRRTTGEEIWSCSWYEIVMWRGDSAAVVIVFAESNQQLELLCDQSKSILEAMTTKAHALMLSRAEDFVIPRTAATTTIAAHQQVKLPAAPLEYRKNLIEFKPPVITFHDGWQDNSKLAAIRRLLPFADSGGNALTESVMAREQLRAIFTMADTDGGGSLDANELSVLLASLGITSENGRALSEVDMEGIMIDMDTFGNAVYFDDFVKWAVGSAKGSEVSTLLKQRIRHQKKEVEATAVLFDQLDADRDGFLDRADFKRFLGYIGLSLNDQEFYSAWIAVDRDRTGEVSFDEFFAWYKTETLDPVTMNIQRAIRMTRLIQAAKGAMVYAVDKGNSDGKRALRSLFDCVDILGTGSVRHKELMQLVKDLQVAADEYDVLMALREMDPSGDMKVDFDEWALWWCGSPSPTQSGILRSKLKLSAFTSKPSGPMLSVVATADEGAGAAEEYLNDLLSAAFAQKAELTGTSLGLFPNDSPFRVWCQHLIQNPVTDRVLVLIIFFNVGLMAAQTPGEEESTSALAIVNFTIMVIFTAEMCMRIVVGGLVRGETAFLSSGWDIFDFVIIMAVWALQLVSLFFDVPDKIGFALAMLRSFRALRFFEHVRNILNSIIRNRVMIGAVLLLLLFLFLLLYVVGFQLFHGVADVTCGALDGCMDCGHMLDECPAAFDCTAQYPDSSACFVWAPNRTTPSDGQFGFDNFADALLTISTIITFDNWDVVCNRFRRNIVVTSAFAWPAFALAVVGIGLFTVNLFVAGLAYSYIKVRKASRNLDSTGGLKKTLVDRFLNDGRGATDRADGSGRHILQIVFPAMTRRCRRIVSSDVFDVTTTAIVLVNIVFLACDHHRPKPDVQFILDVGEAGFTGWYTFELLVKLQAMGFRKYFRFMLNRLDFMIVSASLASYWILLVHKQQSDAKGSTVLRMLRIFKLVRAARVAKFIFRSKSVKEMASKAFAGIDAIISLVIFIFFLLTLSSIAGMHLFHGCSSVVLSHERPRHQPNFDTFWQAFLVSFQVMTGDGWTDLMFQQIDCAGNIAIYYFAFIAFCCTFVLGNLFVAIFMENFELDDEQKRDIQVGMYIQQMAQEKAGAKEWVNTVQNGIRGVESMLSETGTVHVLKNRTMDEFMRGARLTQRITRRTMDTRPMRSAKRTLKTCPGAGLLRRCRKDGVRRQRSQSASANADRPACSGGGWKKRTFWKYFAGTRAFRGAVMLAVLLSAVDTTLRADQTTSNESQPPFSLLIRGFVLCVLSAEAVVKIIAYHFLGGVDEDTWPCPSTAFELAVLATQISTAIGVPYVRYLLPLQNVRILYMVQRLQLMVKSFLASLTAVWTALVLMTGSFLTFGIIGMNLFKGLLWRCTAAELLDRNECEAAGLSWENRPYHWDNIVEASNSLFSVWTLQGWTEMWFWTIDTTYVDQPPSKDFSAIASFCFFANFIVWNSLMLTNLFTGMLCDFFAQTSGSILMTSEQRNWQFMSMFIMESLRMELIRPPGKEKFGGFAYFCFSVVQSRSFIYMVDLTIITGVMSMIGQQAALSVDPAGVLARVLLLLDEYVLFVFTVEACCTICGYGLEMYSRNFKMDAVVLITLWITTLQQVTGLGWAQLNALGFVRALRLVSVVKRVHAIQKIQFMVTLALPQVVSLCSIMMIMFFIFGCYAHELCGDVPRGRDITADANFETVPSAMMVLFQLCTGQSMMRANSECAQAKGPHVLVFFAGFWFTANLLLTNLFIALLLDNFDLMGSEDMAVSDMDIQLFKRRWVRSAGPKGSLHSIHDSISLARVRWFIRQPGMGTFSMMSQADPHFFNRVLFELHPEGREPGTYTREHVLDCEVGRADIRVPFFDLLLALCHVRFSSSCLTLADEVNKSALLIRAHENHAARVLQVYARAFICRGSVNEFGERALPGMFWDRTTGRPQARPIEGVDFVDSVLGRCKICTLPTSGADVRCGCQKRADARKREKLMKRRGGSDFTLSSKSADNMQSKDNTQEQGEDSSDFLDRSVGPSASSSKLAWDCAVGVAAFLTLDSVINVNRITPEHVVADAFDRLQTAVDKRKSTNRLGIIRFTNDNSIESEDEEFSEVIPGPQVRDEVAVDIMLYELNKLNSMTARELTEEFRVFDPEAVGEISADNFRTTLRRLGLSFSPAQFRLLLLAIQIDGGTQEAGDQTVNYVEFVGTSADAIGTKLEELTSTQVLNTVEQNKKSSSRKRWKRKKKEHAQQTHDEDAFDPTATKFVNPLDGIFEDADSAEFGAFESEQSAAFDVEPSKRTGSPTTRLFDSESQSSAGSPNLVLPRGSKSASFDSETTYDIDPTATMEQEKSGKKKGKNEKKKKKTKKNKKNKRNKHMGEEKAAEMFDSEREAPVKFSNPLSGMQGSEQEEEEEEGEGEEEEPDLVEMFQEDQDASSANGNATIMRKRMKKREDVYHYKVLQVAQLRTGMSPESAPLPVGHLAVGQSVVVTAREQLSSGVVGVETNGDSFGRKHVYLDVTKPDGTIQLEYLSNDATSFAFEVCAASPIWLTKSLKYSEADAARSKVYASTQHCGKLKPGVVVEVQLCKCTDEGAVRLKLHDGKGWVTLKETPGSSENLRPLDPLDALRLHLHGLSFSELCSEASLAYQIDTLAIDSVSKNPLNMDPSGSLVELILQNHEQSLRGSDHVATLLRNAAELVEWYSPRDRIKVKRADIRRDRGLVGKLGRIVQLTGTVDHLGRETAEVLLDGERVSRTMSIDHLTKLVDETIATTLFGAIEADDTTTLALLISQPDAPTDAVLLDNSPIPPGHGRLANARNHRGLSLYDAACKDRKMHCAEYLATRLMFQAVVDDNREQLQELLQEAGSIDCLCPPNAFPTIGDDGPYVQWVGRGSQEVDELELYPLHPQAGEPMIERARMLWECAGSPATETAAKLLGGQCWLLLSEMWEDRFGKPYRKPKTGETPSGLQSLLTAAAMKQKFKHNHERLASGQEVEDTLHWKERKAFMTRKTTIS